TERFTLPQEDVEPTGRVATEAGQVEERRQRFGARGAVRLLHRVQGLDVRCIELLAALRFALRRSTQRVFVSLGGTLERGAFLSGELPLENLLFAHGAIWGRELRRRHAKSTGCKQLKGARAWIIGAPRIRGAAPDGLHTCAVLGFGVIDMRSRQKGGR